MYKITAIDTIDDDDEELSNPKYIELIIPEDEGTEFLSHYDYDYKKIVSMLVIEADHIGSLKLAIEIKLN